MSETPILIVGTGRCGSTVVYSLLTMHPQLAWVSSWIDAFPRLRFLAAANRLLELPGMDRFRQRRFFPRPVEPNTIFSRTLTTYCSEALDENTLAEARARLLPVLSSIRRFQGKSRILLKMVGRPVKIELFAQIFERPFFVHITRDIKPTVASLMQVDFYSGMNSLDTWDWEPVPSRYLEYYRECGQADEIAAAIMVKLNRSAIERQLRRIDPSQWIELQYSDFVKAPIDWIQKIARLSGLHTDESLVRRLMAYPIYQHADDKWRRFFSEKQVRSLDEFDALDGS